MKPEAEKRSTCLYCGKMGIVPKPTHLLVMDALACGHEFVPGPSQAPPEKPLESERDQKAAIPEPPITLEDLLKYWDGLEAVALRNYNHTGDSKYLSEALTVRLHLRGLGGDPDTKHLHQLLTSVRAERDQLRMERDALKAWLRLADDERDEAKRSR